MQTVRQWLEQLGLSQYAEVFAENDVDLEALRLLGESDLEKLGVSLGNRKKLLKAIAELNDIGPSKEAAFEVQGSPLHKRRSNIAAERRQLTVIFCDLVGSTELATKLDPEQLRDLMHAYQRACGDIIARYEGHVAQYLGDGLMVYFGWPTAHEDDAVRAIRAGLEITKAVPTLDASTPLRTRVGIHTGLVVVGETGGGDASIPRAAVGDTPNIAARLQALADPNSVVVSARARALATGLFDFADLGSITLKGVAEPVRLFRVSGARAVESRFEAARIDSVLTSMVGRQEEIALLLRVWQQARQGNGQVALLGGEPGIGKSRLIQVLREHIASDPCTTLRYQCSPYHTNSTLYPIIERVERLAGFGREDTPEQKLDKLHALLAGSDAQIDEAVSLFAALLSLPADSYPALKLSPQKQKEKTLEALVSQIEALAHRQQLLMIFEDAHWIDPTTQEFLDLLVPRLQVLQVLMIVTYRPEYSPRWNDHAHAMVVNLNRLSRHQGAELVSNLTEDKPLPEELVEQIVEHTDGVPLFVEELTKAVLESGLASNKGGRLQLSGPLSAYVIPSTLRDSLVARLDRLAPIKEVAQIGACIGREFPYLLVAAVSPLQDDALEEALEQLVRSELIFGRGTPPDATYVFKHALVQDAAYDSLLKSRRQFLHRRIAESLERLFPETKERAPEVLAQHYGAAGVVDVAITYWQQAGEFAFKRMALYESIAHLTRGLEFNETLPASAERERRELALRTSRVLAWTQLLGWNPPEAEADLRKTFELAKSLEHTPSYLPVLYRLWSYEMAHGRVADSLSWATEMQSLAESLDDADLRIGAHDAFLCAHFFLGNLKEAHRHADRLAAVCTPDQGRRIGAVINTDTLTTRGMWDAMCLWLLGYPDQAMRLQSATEAHARSLGQPFGLCWFLTTGTIVLDWIGRSDRHFSYADEAEQLAHAHGIPVFADIFAPMCKVTALLHAGSAAEAVATLPVLLREWTETARHFLWTPYFKAVLAEALARTGQIEHGLQLLEECLAQAQRAGWAERLCLGEILRLKGWMLERRGMPDKAEASLREAIDVAAKQHARSWELRTTTSLAKLISRQGRQQEAVELLTPIYSSFTEGFETKDLKEAKALLDELS
jgi:class 3 adenylate cyclase/tetratricopeptide (TPR) repeat protein